ncbi:MAG: hypothetical protein AAGI53_16680 [Planctomycetota bacterium]
MGSTLVLSVCGAVSMAAVAAPELVSISFPESVPLSQSTTASGPRTVTAPLDFRGIGNIVNPTVRAPGSGSLPSDFVLHQTVGTVDLTDVVVTFEYNRRVLIDYFDIVQHGNGVQTFELLVGDSLDAMTSVGQATNPDNAVEFFVSRFDFDSQISGRFIQLRVIDPELAGQGGWAFYRAYAAFVPAPGVGAALAGGLLVASRRRR